MEERETIDLPTRQGYDRWSAIYDHEDNPLIALEADQVPILLGDVAGLRVLDVGCGTARHSLAMAAAGATVTAVDFSDGMMAQARTKEGAEGVQFVRHDITTPLPFKSDLFDRVTCFLVLDHIPEPLPLFCEMARVCRRRHDHGFVLVSVMHPAVMLREIQAQFTDPDTGHRVRPRSAPNQISDYVMAATGAGMVVDHMGEHFVDDALADRSQRAVKLLGWPLLLMMRMSLAPFQV